MPETKYPDLLTGSLTAHIIRLSLPMIVAMLFQTGFSIIDMVFLGMVSSEAIAVVSIVFPVIFFFVSFAMGIGAGLTSFIARAFGAGDREKASRIAANGLAFSVVIYILLAVIGLLFVRPLFVLLGAGPDILDSVLDYCRIIFIGFIFIFIGAFSNSIIRGEGDTKTPMKFLIVQTAVNLMLDPLLIFGFGPIPAMGVSGAALALVISRMVWVALCVRHFAGGRSQVTPVFRNFRFELNLIKEILRVGIPSTITFLSSSIGLMLFMKLVSGYGSLAIAAFGIGGRIENIAILPALGMSGAVLTIAGQNYGSGDVERTRDTIKHAIFLISVFMISVALIALLFARPINMIFTRDSRVIALGISFLYYRAPFWMLMGVRIMIGAGFNGAGKPKVGLLTLLFGLFVLGLPSALILESVMGLKAVWAGLSIANLTGAASAYIVYRRSFERHEGSFKHFQPKKVPYTFPEK
jgi:putative MATE family efflux protein